MQYRVPYYYKNFSCIGGSCEYTCCRDWRIPIDEESLTRYLHTPGAFGKRLLSGICLTERRFELKEDGRCEFLNAEGLCDICREMGESHMSKACRRFPRHMEDYGTEKEVMLSLSCPEAARVILEDEYQGAWQTVDRADAGTDGKKGETQEISRAWLSSLKLIRHSMVCILKNREVRYPERLAMAAAFAHDVQRRLLRGERSRRQMEKLSARYLSRTAAVRFADRLAACGEDARDSMIRTCAWMRAAQELVPVLPQWRAKQGAVCTRLYHKMTPQEYEQKRRDFDEASADLETAWENLALYFINTYVLGALYDGDVYSKVKLAVFSLTVLREWCLFRYCVTGAATKEDLTGACVRYSREVENSDENLNALEYEFAANRLYGLSSVLRVLCG